jgi:SET domain
VGRLSDGTSTSNQALVHLRDLMLNLDSCTLLLPGQHDYLEGTTRQLTADLVDKIVSTNVHGQHGNKRDMTGDDTSNLYPAISMMNHMKNANATFLPLQGKHRQDAAVVVSSRLIKKGEEICMQYLQDEAAVKAKWGI